VGRPTGNGILAEPIVRGWRKPRHGKGKTLASPTRPHGMNGRADRRLIDDRTVDEV
jgi:hypothetical protein